MKIIFILILTLYATSLFLIFIYSLFQFHLSLLYLSNRKDSATIKTHPDSTYTPYVTVQLPIYNEYYVAERIIKSVAALDYPKDKLEIQVLDDSTDETKIIIDNVVEEIKKRNGIDIKILRRENRVGYKAGALANGLDFAKGEFIAIFDADFLPSTDFLKKTISHFDEPNIAVVQAAWSHINLEYSLLTQMQAFGLDAHFTVEQTGRNCGNYFINFNGTAGVWRKAAIIDSGNWQSDTLTEDLDLSYRAQLRGWKFKYVENIKAPAELPIEINALKSQQYRWTKGAAETASKNIGKIIASKVGLSTKLHAISHLTNSGLFACVFIISILSVPVLYIKWLTPQWNTFFKMATFSLISFAILSLFYFVAHVKPSPNKLKSALRFIIDYPIFLSLSMGISLHNTIAVLGGYLGIKSEFIRTPKFNIANTKKFNSKNYKYASAPISVLNFFELLMALYFAFALMLAFRLRDFGLFPFHFMLFVGYSFVTFYTLKNAWQNR